MQPPGGIYLEKKKRIVLWQTIHFLMTFMGSWCLYTTAVLCLQAVVSFGVFFTNFAGQERKYHRHGIICKSRTSYGNVLYQQDLFYWPAEVVLLLISMCQEEERKATFQFIPNSSGRSKCAIGIYGVLIQDMPFHCKNVLRVNYQPARVKKYWGY